jgi:hypothetical protein
MGPSSPIPKLKAIGFCRDLDKTCVKIQRQGKLELIGTDFALRQSLVCISATTPVVKLKYVMTAISPEKLTPVQQQSPQLIAPEFSWTSL